MNTNPFILDEIGAALLYYYEEFEFECTKNNIRNPWKYEPVTGDFRRSRSLEKGKR